MGIKLEVNAEVKCDICDGHIDVDVSIPRIIDKSDVCTLSTYKIQIYAKKLKPSGFKIYERPDLVMCNPCYNTYIIEQQKIQDDYDAKKRQLVDDIREKINK